MAKKPIPFLKGTRIREEEEEEEKKLVMPSSQSFQIFIKDVNQYQVYKFMSTKYTYFQNHTCAMIR